MKLLINTSTLKGTGVSQVAVSFIQECRQIGGNEYIVFMSPNIANNLHVETFPSNFSFYVFGKESLYGLKGKKDIRKMKRLEKELSPDAVFSVFGPSLWRPKAPHLMGFAYGHYVYDDLEYSRDVHLNDSWGRKLRRFVHMRQLKNNGDYYVCETEDVANRLSKKYNISPKNIYTVSNTVGTAFIEYKGSFKNPGAVFKFYTLASAAPNKNFSILNEVIPILRERHPSGKIKFYVTIPEESYNQIFDESVKEDVINVGPLKVEECPDFVDSCDALFLPTLLECFSASYPEAMLLGKPILTSDLPFATSVCGDSASYFDPLNPSEIAERIFSLVENPHLYQDLQNKGLEQIKVFPSPHERAEEYIKILKTIAKKNVEE